MAPNTGIEKALHYAMVRVETGSIEPNQQLDEDKKREQYTTLLDQVDLPQKVAELQLRFDEDKPYFDLCGDEAIAAYFSRWGVPIHSRRDLTLFSEALADKVRVLAPYDENVQRQLAQRDYQKQLQELPAAISRLEQTVSEFDALKPSFNAVLRYVWEAVTHQGFKMEEDGDKAIKKYPGAISIQAVVYNSIVYDSVRMQVRLSTQDSFEWYLTPHYKDKIVVPARKRRFWLDRKAETEKTNELERLEILPINLFTTGYDKNTEKILIVEGFFDRALFYDPVELYIKEKHPDAVKRVVRVSPEELADLLKGIAVKSPDRRLKSFQTGLRLVLNLPILMGNYTKRLEGSMRNILETVSAEESDTE